MKNKAFLLIKFLIGWPLSIVALFFIGKIVVQKFPQILQSITHPNFFILFLSVVSFLLYFLFRSLFWQQLLALENYVLPLKETTWLWAISELKRYIPGNIVAILDRTTQFKKKGLKRGTTAKLWLLESEFVVFATLLLSLLSVNFIIFGILPAFPHKHMLMIFVIFAIISFLFFALYSKKKFLPKFIFTQNLHLLLLMTVAFIFFGLGTYFAIASFVFLYPADLSGHIAFFAFSLLLGYLSFITPTGLGVREAVMTVGLSKYLFSLPLASAGALFSRIIFIASELLFLMMSYLWQKTATHIRNIEKFVMVHKYALLLWLFIGLYIVYFTVASFLRFTNFYTGRFDLGNMDQTVWNTVHGRFFELTDPNGTTTISRLAYHADFILVVLSPLYFIWQDPRMLLFIQTVVLALGALFVYLIAKHILKSKPFSLLFAILYLSNPSIQYANLYDFHGVVLATTFLLGVWYFFLKRKWLFFIIYLLLAALTKEEVWLVTGMMGLFVVIHGSLHVGSRFLSRVIKLLVGIGIFSLSTVAFWFLVFKAIPFARGGGHFALSYYSDFGMSPGTIMTTILFSPWKTLFLILQPGKLLYLLELFSPLGLISFVSPLFLIFSLPELGINLLSNNSQLHQIYFHYTAVITPFLFLSAIYGTKTLLKKVKAHYIALYLLTVGIVCAYLFGPLPFAWHPNLDMFMHPVPNAAIIDDILTTIPRRFSLAATNNIGSHLSHRQQIFTIPVGLDKADVIVFLLNDQYAQPSLPAQRQMVATLLKNPAYVKLFSQGDFYVFEKKELVTIKRVKPKTLFPLFPSTI